MRLIQGYDIDGLAAAIVNGEKYVPPDELHLSRAEAQAEADRLAADYADEVPSLRERALSRVAPVRAVAPGEDGTLL